MRFVSIDNNSLFKLEQFCIKFIYFYGVLRELINEMMRFTTKTASLIQIPLIIDR